MERISKWKLKGGGGEGSLSEISERFNPNHQSMYIGKLHIFRLRTTAQCPLFKNVLFSSKS